MLTRSTVKSAAPARLDHTLAKRARKFSQQRSAFSKQLHDAGDDHAKHSRAAQASAGSRELAGALRASQPEQAHPAQHTALKFPDPVLELHTDPRVAQYLNTVLPVPRTPSLPAFAVGEDQEDSESEADPEMMFAVQFGGRLKLQTPAKFAGNQRYQELHEQLARYASISGTRQQMSDIDRLLSCPLHTKALMFRLVVHPWFDRVVLILVLLNSVCLALDNPLLASDDPLRLALDQLDVVFVTLFTIEATCKMVGLGLVNTPEGYFRSAWNWMDFLIVLEGLLSTGLGGGGKLSGLRAFRVLRPLRTVSRLGGLKLIVKALLASLPQLCNTILVCCFFFIIFGIAGTLVWNGQLNNRCVDASTLQLVDPLTLCGSGYSCAEGQRCVDMGTAPEQGLFSFDNVGWSMLTLLTSVTLEGWTTMMYYTQDATSVWSWLYFVLVVLLGNYLLLNLALAVILTRFTDAQADMAAKDDTEDTALLPSAQRFALLHKHADAQREQDIVTQVHAAESKLITVQNFATEERRMDGHMAQAVLTTLSSSTKENTRSSVSSLANRLRNQQAVLAAEPIHARRARFALESVASGLPRDGMLDLSLVLRMPVRSAADRSSAFAAIVEARSTPISAGDSRASTASPGLLDDGHHRSSKPGTRRVSITAPPSSKAHGHGGAKEFVDIDPFTLTDTPRAKQRSSLMVAAQCSGKQLLKLGTWLHGPLWLATKSMYTLLHKACKPVVQSPVLAPVIMFCIIANTVVLAMEHHGMDEETAVMLDEANFVFSIIFAAEAGLKLLGLGVRGYFSDRFNLFDFTLVVLSFGEMLIGGSNSSSLGAFRAIRIVRVFKLLRFMSSMMHIVNAVSRSINSFSYIALLLLLFGFIFSVLGMQIFAGTLGSGDALPRSNFDSLHWSFVTVFQVLAGDGWNDVMYTTAQRAGTPSIAYFISWVIIGQFLLLNLFLAVLLDAFQQGNQNLQRSHRDDSSRTRREFRARIVQDCSLMSVEQSLAQRRVAGTTTWTTRGSAWQHADETAWVNCLAAPSLDDSVLVHDYGGRGVLCFDVARDLGRTGMGQLRAYAAVVDAGSVLATEPAQLSELTNTVAALQRPRDVVRGQPFVAIKQHHERVRAAAVQARKSLTSMAFKRPRADVAFMMMMPPLPAQFMRLWQSAETTMSDAARLSAPSTPSNQQSVDPRSIKAVLHKVRSTAAASRALLRVGSVRAAASMLPACPGGSHAAIEEQGEEDLTQARHEHYLLLLYSRILQLLAAREAELSQHGRSSGPSSAFVAQAIAAGGEQVNQLLTRMDTLPTIKIEHKLDQVERVVRTKKLLVVLPEVYASSAPARDRIDDRDDEVWMNSVALYRPHMAQPWLLRAERAVASKLNVLDLWRRTFDAARNVQRTLRSSEVLMALLAELVEQLNSGEPKVRLSPATKLATKRVLLATSVPLSSVILVAQRRLAVIGWPAALSESACLNHFAVTRSKQQALQRAADVAQRLAFASVAALAGAVPARSRRQRARPASTAAAGPSGSSQPPEQSTQAAGSRAASPPRAGKVVRLHTARALSVHASLHDQVQGRSQSSAQWISRLTLKRSVVNSGDWLARASSTSRKNLRRIIASVTSKSGASGASLGSDIDPALKARYDLLRGQHLLAVHGGPRGTSNEVRLARMAFRAGTQRLKRCASADDVLDMRAYTERLAACRAESSKLRGVDRTDSSSLQDDLSEPDDQADTRPAVFSLRALCRKLVDPQYALMTVMIRDRKQKITLDGIILALIIMASIIMATEPPPSLDGSSDPEYAAFEIFFAVVFSLEVLIKVLALGLFQSPTAYLRNGYNVIDFVTVLASVLNILLSSVNLGFLRTLRLLRCLRPLRMIARNAGMKLVVTALIHSIKGLTNVFAMLALIFTVFAVAGVQLFSGKMHDCNDPAFPPNMPMTGGWYRPEPGTLAWEPPCNASYTFEVADGTSVARAWLEAPFNFDNIGNALLLLFVTASGEAWPTIMFRAADCTEVDYSSERNASPNAVWFFLLFIVVGTFFFVNLFTGVVFERFMTLKKDLETYGLLTDAQRLWVQQQRRLNRARPEANMHPPIEQWRTKVFEAVKSAKFSAVVTMMVVGSVVLLALTFYGEPAWWTNVTEICNLVFTIVFVLEATLKLVAYGRQQYFAKVWNQFDFVVALAGLADVLLSMYSSVPQARVVVKALRLGRVLRVLRLMRQFRGTRQLLLTLWSALPALANVGALLLLLFFIFAIMGVQIFGNIASVPGTAINRHTNFHTFGQALLVLVRAVTGESWEQVMQQTANDEQGTPLAPLYWVGFMLIANFVMVNLFVTIIVDEFQSLEEGEDDSAQVGMSDRQLRAFKTLWSVCDPKGTSYIHVSLLEPLLRYLPKPLGLTPPNAQNAEAFSELMLKLKQLSLTAYNNHVTYTDVLLAVHRSAFGGDTIPQEVLAASGIAPHLVKERLAAQFERKRLLAAAKLAAAVVGGLKGRAILQSTKAALQVPIFWPLVRCLGGPERHISHDGSQSGGASYHDVTRVIAALAVQSVFRVWRENGGIHTNKLSLHNIFPRLLDDDLASSQGIQGSWQSVSPGFAPALRMPSSMQPGANASPVHAPGTSMPVSTLSHGQQSSEAAGEEDGFSVRAHSALTVTPMAAPHLLYSPASLPQIPLTGSPSRGRTLNAIHKARQRAPLTPSAAAGRAAVTANQADIPGAMNTSPAQA